MDKTFFAWYKFQSCSFTVKYLFMYNNALSPKLSRKFEHKRFIRWKIMERPLSSPDLNLILVVFGIFRSVWVWLGWLGKNWMYVWALTCGRKGRIDRHLFWLTVCVRRFFFLDCVGFHQCNVCCDRCMGWSLFLPEVVSLLVYFEMFVRFLMVCDVVCMNDIPNLVSLS